MPTPYATVAGLIATFGERQIIDLTDIGTPRSDVVDNQVGQQACDRANVEVDASVLSRYAAPAGDAPPLLVNIALDLAYYYLFQSEPPSWVQVRYTQAQKQLQALRDGKLSLGLSAAGVPVQAEAADLAVMAGGSKVWGRDAV